MLQDQLDVNARYIQKYSCFRKHDDFVEKCVEILNTQKVISVFGIQHSEKTGLIHSLLKKTEMFSQTFYFNAELDTLKEVKNEKDCIILFDIFVRIHGVPKIIVLENCNAIENIQHFITQLIQTKKYKIILVGNNIRVSGVPSIEYFPTPNQKEYLYGGLPKVTITPHNGYKKDLLGIISHDIILREIIIPYNIKNIELFIQVLSFLAKQDIPHSQRELHRNLQEHGVDISLLTLMDYLTSCENTYVLQQIQSYDIKKGKHISSQNSYYFGDVGIRQHYYKNSIIGMKNALYLSLKRGKYNVSSGIFGVFNFDFYAIKDSGGYCIHMSESEDSKELRKLARKLAKIDNNFEKYLVIPSTENLAMRKFEEQGVQIISFEKMYEILNH